MKSIIFTIKFLSTLVLIGMLFGCGNSEKLAEEQAYVKRIKSRKIKEVEPLPEIKPYEPFLYAANNLRSPFVPPAHEEPAGKVVVKTNGIHPDFNRHKEVLENYPLDALKMVGTVEQNNKRWGLVIDPTGIVYRLSKGNYMGQNHGRITEIANDKIVLTEIVPDSNGGWRERPASMALSDNKSAGSHKGRR